MGIAPVIVQGIVKPDGTLEEQGTVSLPAGPVQVQVQPAPLPPKEDWWQFLKRSRAELERYDATFRRGVDIIAEMEAIRVEHEPHGSASLYEQRVTEH